MNYYIRTIKHEEQRYNTCGDWFQGQLWGGDDGDAQIISVSDMSNTYYEALVGVHELVEVILCRAAGITQQRVDAFDKEFEAARAEARGGYFKFRGEWVPTSSEPGDHNEAPYRNQHQFATLIERMLAYKLEVDWDAYEAAIEAL